MKKPKKQTLPSKPNTATISPARFRYRITYNDAVIAMFIHLPDRSLSIRVLKEQYPDCRFEEHDE